MWTLGLKPQRLLTGIRSYDNNIYFNDPWMDHRSWSRLPAILGQASIVGSVTILWLSTIDICGVNDLWVFSSILNANPAIIGFFSIITTRSSCICLIGDSWKSVARELTLPFLISVTHIASFHLVINSMGKSAWVQHSKILVLQPRGRKTHPLVGVKKFFEDEG